MSTEGGQGFWFLRPRPEGMTRPVLLTPPYARWMGLDRLFSWVEERELEDAGVVTQLERCAIQGNSLKPVPA